MAIDAKDLDKKVKDAMAEYNDGDYKNEKNSPKHLKILGDVMKEYFEDNIEISYGWAATLPPPASTPDPVVLFNSTVEFPSFNLTAAVDLVTLALATQISILGGVISHADGFTVIPGTFTIKLPLFFPPADNAETAMFDSVISPVCAWVLTLVNPIPILGAHGPYSGATIGMLIK